MRKVPITITLPELLIRDLHLYIPQGGISGFVSKLIEKGLDEKKQLLAKEFMDASLDEKRAPSFSSTRFQSTCNVLSKANLSSKIA